MAQIVIHESRYVVTDAVTGLPHKFLTACENMALCIEVARVEYTKLELSNKF